ncbi:MAG TPA: ABC transporter permease [Thermoanaerobaculia bacterium]|nr:ABC transporter permease [Thermoanaerobaculia bacterium]
MSGFLQDLRYAARGIRRSPGFSAVAILILGLGTGASTTIFSLVDALYLKTLPARESGRLVEIYQTRRPGEYFNLSYLDYLFYRSHTRSLSGLAAHYSHAPINLVTAAGSREINGSVATASYFEVLGLKPRLGRFFAPDEDRVPGRDPVAVIGFGLWQREFGGDPHVLGRVLRLNGTPFTVVGVAPENFHGVPLGGLATDVWIPSAMFRVGYRYCDAFAPGCRVVTMIGRLAPGRSLEESREELAVEARDLAAANPDDHRDLGLFVTPARGVDPEYRQETGMVAPTLLALAGLLLAATCANLAGLLLARGSVRRREIAIRTALGAARGRLMRQLLVESVLLSLAGGALGVVLAFWGKDLVGAFYAADSEGRRAYFGLALDPIVLAAALFTGMSTGVVFGLAPALHATRPGRGAGFHEATSASRSDRHRLRDALVVAQVAISVVLATGACLLVRSVTRVYRGPGFDPSRVVLLRLRPSLVAYGPEQASAFQREVIRRLGDVPGVVSASPAERPPLPGWGGDLAIWLRGHEPDLPEHGLHVLNNRVGPRYFETLGIPLVEGREFDDRDKTGMPEVAIVNESLAKRLWPRGGALGSTVVAEGRPMTVVGVVRDAQYRSPSQPAPPFLYASYWQTPTIDTRPIDSRTHVRIEGNPREVLQRVRREIAAIDPGVPISEDRPLTEWLDYAFQPLRVAGAVLATFGGLALLLAAIGLYGLLAYSVGRRTREIAIRMALGADAGRVARSVVRGGAALAATGAVLGLVATLISASLLDRFLVDVSPNDPVALAGGVVLLIVVAALASYLPARKASRIDPLVALRNE